MTTRTIRWGLALSLVVGAASGAQPGNWAEPLFEKLDHDFGLVAKGAETKHRIKIVNKYPNPVHIAGAGTMCKCATARALTDTIAPGETGYVEVTLDTKKFEGNRDTTLIVSFDRPQFAEVRIPIKAFIRNDLEVTPGKLEFGSIARGSAAERRIHIALFRPGWTIREVVNRNKNLAVHFREIGRNPGGANYELVAALKASAPAGELREQLTLVTDDPANPHVPILVEGRVEAEFSVSNELLDFGTLRPGMRQKVNLVVRGRRPFTIEKIESETTAGVFEVRLPKDARQIHVLELSVIAPTEAGTLREEFTISIPGCAEPVTFKAVCKVVPVTAAQP